jgi:hypothetical protein
MSKIVKLISEGWWKQGEAHSSKCMMAEEVADFETVEAARMGSVLVSEIGRWC